MVNAALTVGRPLTPRRANSGKASRAHRLSALHRRSGEITHDLNNLLGIILSANERLAEELGAGGEQQKLALLALGAAERAARLLSCALCLAHSPSVPRAEVVDGTEALVALERMAGQAIGLGVRLRVFGSTLPLYCLGERTGLEMALLNLCLNADQAMPDGGRIFVKARQAYLGDAEASRLGLSPGVFIAFVVRDTGPGMAAETMARATEALFTTKQTGTGLGLTSVRNYSASCGGALLLQSKQGYGTTATLYLPVAGSALGQVEA